MGAKDGGSPGGGGSDEYLRTFSQILEIVENELRGRGGRPEDLVTGAIRGMLTTLDPHSNFLDQRSPIGR